MKKRMEGKGFGFGVSWKQEAVGERVEDEVGGLVTW